MTDDPDPAGERTRTHAAATPGPDATTADPGATRPSGGSGPAVPFDPAALPARYTVLRALGRGGFGEVVLARDERLRREVAVKALARPHADDPAARARFLAEARAAAAVRDDHVVAVFEVGGDDEPVPYLVMEYVAGPTLQQRIAAGPLPPAEVVRVGTEVARGLAAAHAAGLVHRDVKPANVLLDQEAGRAKVTDFGLAHAAADAGAAVAGGVTGTPQYMSPEQARGEPLGPHTDLFSLGSVLYAMCAGAPPFRPDTTAAVIRQVAHEAPRPVREANPKVPPWLAAVIARLHAPDPADRFQSAREVVHALAAGPAALGPAAEHWRPEWRTPAPAAARRARSWAAPAAAVLLLAIGVGLYGLVGGPDDRRFAEAPREESPTKGVGVGINLDAELRRRAEEEARRERERADAVAALELHRRLSVPPLPPSPPEQKVGTPLVPGATTPKTPDGPPPPPRPRVRPPHPFPPPDRAAWESPWEKVGDVRVRVCGAGITKVPLEARKKTFLSPDTYFVVWVEIENAGAVARTYRRWQPTLTGECTLRYASGTAVSYAVYPTDTGREWFSEFSQPVAPGGPPLLESLVFSRPDPTAAGDLTLTLDATRVGATTGLYRFTIPHNVWARR